MGELPAPWNGPASDAGQRVDQPLISVPLCTYNGSAYLHEQLQSILAQDHSRLEVIAVDDRSGDDTVAILRAYAGQDSRIRVVENAVNLGPNRNFEEALKLCRGAFIAPADQDDIWAAEKLTTLLRVIGSATMAFCDSELVDAAGSPLNTAASQQLQMGDIDDPAPFVFSNCVSGHAMLFRRELLQHALPVPAGLFYDWWLAAIAAGLAGIVYTDRKLVRYRQHAASVTDMLLVRRRPLEPRPAGRQLRRRREIGQRLALLAAVPGRHQRFLQEFALLWDNAERQWISPSLAWLMMRNRHRLHRLQRRSPAGLLTSSVKHLWGVRLKRLLNRRAYSSEGDGVRSDG
jgi:glycosyltransferase involved in cell wall biosynthesis